MSWRRWTGLLQRQGGLLVVEGGVGLGQDGVVEAACGRAKAQGYEVLRSRGSELENGVRLRRGRASSLNGA